jgi:hypothetical protein
VLNPTLICYYFWPSAEIFLASLLVISIVFFYNKNYYRSAFFLSLAGTLNIIIMAIGMFMIIDYFMELFQNTCYQYEENNFLSKFYYIFKTNVRNIVLYALSFFPCLITTIIYIINFKAISMSSVFVASRSFGTLDPGINFQFFLPRVWACCICQLNFRSKVH